MLSKYDFFYWKSCLVSMTFILFLSFFIKIVFNNHLWVFFSVLKPYFKKNETEWCMSNVTLIKWEIEDKIVFMEHELFNTNMKYTYDLSNFIIKFKFIHSDNFFLEKIHENSKYFGHWIQKAKIESVILYELTKFHTIQMSNFIYICFGLK